MEKRATIKQIRYLNHLLYLEKKCLVDITTKGYDQLTHGDIVNLFKHLNAPLTVDLRNLEYRINKQTDDYIIGEQYNILTNRKIMDVISFKRLMVLDYDVSDVSDVTLGKQDLLIKIKDKLLKYPYSFSIYETFRGYHVYCTSNEFDYSEHSTHKLMKELECDNFYIGFTKYVGFVVRLNKKPKRDETYIERFVESINDHLTCKKLCKLVKSKDKLMKIYETDISMLI